MSYLEVYRLSRTDLFDIARPFPIGCSKIRWEAFRLALIRTIIASKTSQVPASDRSRTSFKPLCGPDLHVMLTSLGRHVIMDWQAFSPKAQRKEESDKGEAGRDAAVKALIEPTSNPLKL